MATGLSTATTTAGWTPKGSTIRAQAASILMNFDKGFAQEG